MMKSLFLSLVLALSVGSQAHANGLKYFGYYASAMQGVGTGDYTDQVKDHSNVIWIRGTDGIVKLARAKALGMKAVIDLESIFFNSQLSLSSNYEAAWEKFSNDIAPYSDAIAAFYPKDEPFEIGRRSNVDTDTMRSNLEAIAKLLKQDYPNIPIALLYTTNDVEMLRSSNMVPKQFDWFGFDCYNGSFENCSHHSIPWYTNEIRSKLNSKQKIILVPQASINSYSTDTPYYQDQAYVAHIALQYYEYAAASNDVIALFPFLYQTFPENNKYWIGTQDLPTVLARFTSIGKAIIKPKTLFY